MRNQTRVIRESNGDVDLSGTPAELNGIAGQIEQVGPGGTMSFSADVSANPHPYHRCLTALDVWVTDGPVRILVAGERLGVTAGPHFLKTLAGLLKFPTDARRGTHAHHEWFDGNEYISPASIPLVISIA